MRSLRLLLSISILVLFAACATITRGTTDTLVVESDPAGANVSLSIGLVGKTPATFKVSRKGGFVAKIEMDGYETVEVQVGHKVAGAGSAGMAGNILLGGFIGAAVDAGSGAMYDLVPNPIKVKLVPLGRNTQQKPAETAPGDDSASVLLYWR